MVSVTIRNRQKDAGHNKGYVMKNNNHIRKAAATLGKIGGSKTSEAKKRASRENGKLGGRPRRFPRVGKQSHTDEGIPFINVGNSMITLPNRSSEREVKVMGVVYKFLKSGKSKFSGRNRRLFKRQ